jgi:hypothetical protein
MDRPIPGPEASMRMVARTGSIEEANQIAERYEAQGYETQIVKKNQAGLTIYEVWAGKKPDVFTAPGPPRL